MDFLYETLSYLSSVFGSIKDFLYSIPDFVLSGFTYAWYFLIKLYISIKISMVEMAYSVASMLLSEYEVYTVLNAMFNKLSPDLRSAAHQLGVVDAIRIVIDAMATAFVLRIMGW